MATCTRYFYVTTAENELSWNSVSRIVSNNINQTVIIKKVQTAEEAETNFKQTNKLQLSINLDLCSLLS